MKILSLHLFIVIAIFYGEIVFAQETQSGIINECMLHPLGTFTGETFRKGKFSYAQPPTLLPGWAFWGVTNNVTVELDITAWIIGIPDMNVRIRLFKKSKLQIASEIMIFYISDKIGDLDSDNENLFFERTGMGGYSRINASWILSKKFRLHLSGGLSYSQSLKIGNEDRNYFYGNYFEPVVSIGIDWRPKNWMSFHSTFSYGETFVYYENHPRKYQFTYGFRIAPFQKSKYGIIKKLRIEFASITSYFPDVKETFSSPIPLYPYIYWQWGGKQ